MLGRPPASYAPGRPCVEWGLSASTLATCATPRLCKTRYPAYHVRLAHSLAVLRSSLVACRRLARAVVVVTTVVDVPAPTRQANHKGLEGLAKTKRRSHTRCVAARGGVPPMLGSVAATPKPRVTGAPALDEGHHNSSEARIRI